MSPRTFVARSAAILSLAALGLAACESKTVVQPPVQTLNIVVSPAAVTLTAAGQKAQFVAVVTGGAATDVKTYKWASSNSAVATVDASGVVTAVANGVSTITATADADANVKSAGLVTVNITTTPPPVVVPPTISIQSVTNNNGQNVLLSNVFGQINVNLNVDPGQNQPISKVEVLVDGTTACSQSFSTGSAQVGVEATNAPVVISCSINTAALKADGSPVYTNGNHTITARLVGPTGNVLANPATEIFTFNNQNSLGIAVAASKTATNPTTGIVWNGGTLTVTVTPAIFGLTGNLTTVTVNIKNGGTVQASKTLTATTNTGVLTFVFADTTLQNAGVFGQTDSVVAVSGTSAGVAGPSGAVLNTLAIDEVAPVITGTGLSGNGFNLNSPTAPFWLNAASTMSLSSLGFGTGTIVDAVGGVPGVNNNTVTLTSGLASAGSAGATNAVTTVAALGQAAAGTDVLKLTACDALGNCRSVLSPAFGVDLAPPMIVVADTLGKTNPAGSINIIAADTGTVGTTIVSGTPLSVLGVKVLVFTPAGNFCASLDGTTVTAVPTTGCPAIAAPTNTNITLPAATVAMGYDSVVVTAVDSAGNTNTLSSKLFLVDTQSPTVGGITFPASVTGGSSVTFSTSAADNVDLGAWQAFEAFGGVLSLQVGSGTVSAFGLPMVTSATPSVVTNPFIISVQMDTAGAVTKATAVGFSVGDVAGNTPATNFLDITATITDPGTFSFRDSAKISGWSMTATTPLSLTGATSLPKTAALKATAIVKTGAAQPFSSVVFYARQPAGVGPYVQIATAGAGFATENIINRTYDYSATWTPTTAATYDVIAVALDAKGHALVSPVVPVVVNP